MKKNAIVLLDDYWHPEDTILPLLPLIFDEKEWFVKVTEDPNYIGATNIAPDLIMNFKDGIANTQIPTKNWYENGAIPPYIPMILKASGTGYIGVHCGLANIPEDNPFFKDILYGRFISHPPKCEVRVHITKNHPVTEGVSDFVIEDEHYQMVGDWDKTEVLAESTSVHNTQVAVWAHEVGASRVVGITPGHTTEVLTNPEMVKLFKNAINWAARK